MASRFLLRLWTCGASLAGLRCITVVGAICQREKPDRSDDFDSPASLAGWHLCDGPGHAGHGRRTPSAVSVSDGVLTITGDAKGNSEGTTWSPGQMCGRWEVCVKSTRSAPNYHSVLLLWPDGSGQSSSSEVDFMEIVDPARWHSWAVEWISGRIATFVGGAEWWENTDTAYLPTGSMKLCTQLDNFGGDISEGGQQIVDWVRQYSLAGQR